jgi:hypothetical protein
MGPSVLLYTILFTLQDKPVHKNQYVQMFLIWFSCLIKTQALNKNDLLLLIIDKYTKSYLENETVFYKLRRKMIVDIQFLILPQPKTLLEGCMWKYNALEKEYFEYNNKDILFYSDIDILFNKSFKTITDAMIPQSIVTHGEGRFETKYFSEGIPDEEKNEFLKYIPNIQGLSAGKFAIYGTSIALDIFNKIIEYNKVETKYFTLEQPFFNRAVYNYLYIDKKISLIYFMNNYIIHATQIENNTSSILIDCVGDTGDYGEHMNKMLNAFCVFYTDTI